jgi:hypothetical protein
MKRRQVRGLQRQIRASFELAGFEEAFRRLPVSEVCIGDNRVLGIKFGHLPWMISESARRICAGVLSQCGFFALGISSLWPDCLSNRERKWP